jgi:UDP-2-acetamido-2,6-beta-L-arabino-hexul-4-ose reductase
MALEGRKRPEPNGFCAVRPEYTVTLGRLAKIITGFAASRDNLTHDYDRADPFLRKLYSTFTSYIPEDKLSVPADMKPDPRGWFAELVKSPHFGQISVSRTKPGIVRGNHWHNSKVEKFIVVEGEAVIRFRQYSGGEVIEYPVSGEKIEIVDIPPGYSHSIQNIGRTDVLTIFWAGEMFDPADPDVFALEVSHAQA